MAILHLNINNIANITVKGVDYCYIIHDINLSTAIHFFESSLLDDCVYIYNAYQRN